MPVRARLLSAATEELPRRRECIVPPESVSTRQVRSNFTFLVDFSYIFPPGNVYIADANNRIRKVTVSTGIITTIAGTGTSSYSGDNGAATSATLKYPRGVALDASGTTHNYYLRNTSFICCIPR